ncbi:uncharacterized protein WM277_022684 [Molossus nigricans]
MSTVITYSVCLLFGELKEGPQLNERNSTGFSNSYKGLDGRPGPAPARAPGKGLEFAAREGLAGERGGARARGAGAEYLQRTGTGKEFQNSRVLSPTPSGVASASTRAPRKEGSPPFGPKRKLSGPRLHLTPHRPTTPPHARQAACPAPARPPGARRRGINKFNYYRMGEGASRETRGKGWVSAPQRRRPARRPRRARGGAGRPGRGGRARSPRGPPARGLAGTPRPTPPPWPAQAAPLAPLRPRLDPVRPPAVAARGRPRGPQIRVRGAGNGLGSSAAAATAPHWAPARAFPCQARGPRRQGCRGCTRRGSSLLQHHYRHCEDITPESRSSALRNDNFPTILEAEGRGAGGKSAPAPDKVQISTSRPWEKVHTCRPHRRPGQSGPETGVLEKRFHLHQGGNVSASSDGKKSLQDPGFPECSCS